MRLYSGSSGQFIQDTIQNQIAEKLKSAFFNYFRYYPSPAEVNSWRNSLRSISQVFQYAELLDHGVILEYQLPLTSRRLDCLICGKDDRKKDNAVIVELKQWEKCEESDKDNEVLTWVGGAKREVLHPSVQVRQYQMYLQDTHTAFNDDIDPIGLEACTYLHNYNYYVDDVIFANKFNEALKDCPLFTADNVDDLKDYLYGRLMKGDGLRILKQIEESRYRPSKKLMDHVGNIIKGKSEYILLDEQLIVYDTVLSCAKKGFHDKQKAVIIIKGGPGTGKSVIAINLMADLLLKGYNAHYATGSRAFTGTLREIIGTRGSAQFKFFNSYSGAEFNVIDILIADEAHRIRSTSNSRFTPRIKRTNLPQIEELLRASKVAVFFIDDDQVVRPNEIGSTEYIKENALKNNCKIYEYELEAQFRCNGSDAFLNWINNTLSIKRTANVIWDQHEEFDFKIFASPLELENAIRQKVSEGFTGRVTAGFCWDWSMPNEDGTLKDDVVIGDYKRPWDAKPEARILAPGIPPASLWAYDPNGINQVGCIYTAQGFEFDYVGVIFGEDLVYDFDKQEWVGDQSKSSDSVVKRSADKFIDLVKHAYRVLLSRGMKGCYVYFMNKDTERFFKSRIETRKDIDKEKELKFSDVIKEDPVVLARILADIKEEERFNEYLPVYSLAAAAGKFGENMDVQEEGWLKVNIARKLNKKMFIAKVVGRSMEPLIPDDSYCIFSSNVVGSRQGKIVLVQHHSIHPEKTANRRIFSLASTRPKINLSTNRYKLTNLEMLYPAEDLIKKFLMGVPLRQLELVFSSSVNQTRRQGEQIPAQSMQSSRAPFLRQTQAFEPVDQIVSQENQMKMNLIGQEAVGRNTSQRKTFLEFSDIQFASGSGLVKMPYVLWVQWKIGNKSMIKVILEFPKCKLVVFFLGFGLGMAHYDELMRLVPIVRLVSKSSHLPPVFSESMITKVLNLFLNRLGHLGYDCVTNSSLVERFDEFVVEEPRVGTNTDTIEISGDLFSASRPKLLGSACRMSVSRTQEAAPCIPGMPFEANQRMITGASRLGGVVSYFGAFYLPAEYRQDCRVQIEDEAAGRMRQTPDFPAQQVVHTDNTLRLRQTDPLQEFSQGRRFRELLQTQQLLETTIVLDYSGIEDTSHPRNHRVNHALQEFDRMIDTASSLPAGMPLQYSFEVQLSTKPLEKCHTTEMRKGGILEGECDFSDTFAHYTETLLLVMFPRHKYSCSDYSVSSSVMPTFLSVFCGDSPFFQVHDSDTGGSYTVKKYTSKKKHKPDETWEHEEIILLPLNKTYEPITISSGEAGDFKVIAEFIDVIKNKE